MAVPVDPRGVDPVDSALDGATDRRDGLGVVLRPPTAGPSGATDGPRAEPDTSDVHAGGAEGDGGQVSVGGHEGDPGTSPLTAAVGGHRDTEVVTAAPEVVPPVPEVVRAITSGAEIELVWHNELGGLTYRWHSDAGERYVKWVRADAGIPTSEEAARLQWAEPFARVPRVVDVGASQDGSWLITEALPGRSAVDDRWISDPKTAVTAIGEGLAALHEQLHYDSCPFDWTTIARLEGALTRKGEGPFDRTLWNEQHAILTDDEVIARLQDVPDPDPVVCHGDPCAPNTLIGDDGYWCGHVDFDELGRGDRWADLAVAAWSTEWNYGPGWHEVLIHAYGVEPDPERAAFYRLLWDLG